MLVENPRIQAEGHREVVLDYKKSTMAQTLRFWGGLLLAICVLTVMFVPRLQSFHEPVDTAILLGTAALGTVLLVLGARSNPTIVPLATVDRGQSKVHVSQEASEVIPDGGRSAWFEEIRHIVFGMTRYPVNVDKPDVKVEAFTVCLELFDGSVIPVVEASTDKQHAYQVAKYLSETTETPVLQAGLGF